MLPNESLIAENILDILQIKYRTDTDSHIIFLFVCGFGNLRVSKGMHGGVRKQIGKQLLSS